MLVSPREQARTSIAGVSSLKTEEGQRQPRTEEPTSNLQPPPDFRCRRARSSPPIMGLAQAWRSSRLDFKGGRDQLAERTSTCLLGSSSVC